MIRDITVFLAFLALPAIAAAQDVHSEAPPISAYRQVMQAQYAAKAAPQPLRPEEAQRVYETYLRSIGQPARDRDAGDNAGTPSR